MNDKGPDELSEALVKAWGYFRQGTFSEGVAQMLFQAWMGVKMWELGQPGGAVRWSEVSVSGGIIGPLPASVTTATGEMPEPGHHITAGNVGLTDQRGALKPFVLPKGFSSRGYRLLKDITGEMRWENKGESETKGPYVATVGLPGGSEYGDGSSEKTALLDLLVTLGESRKSLEAREATLDEESLEDLTELRLMVEEER